jgi:hypothetical protein
MGVLAAPNPYAELADGIRTPLPAELRRGCALLEAFERRAELGDADQVALAEYAFFARETYLFELVGLQLLGEMTSRLHCYEAIPALAEQAIDEARHVAAYRAVLAALPEPMPPPSPDQVYAAFVLPGTIEEKAVTAFVVLESLAIGIFSARAHLYGATSVAALDRRILREESRHQTNGIDILGDLVRDGRLSFAQVVDATRAAVGRLGELLSPAPLLVRFGLEAGSAEIESVRGAGMIAHQRRVTQRCIRHALRRLRRRVPGS